jgi:hypothetical protein
MRDLDLPPVWADQTLVGLSNLTGDERYRQAARDATAYMLAHFQAPCGLLVWGEHAFAAQYGGQAGQARSGERTSDIGLYYSADSQ